MKNFLKKNIQALVIIGFIPTLLCFYFLQVVAAGVVVVVYIIVINFYINVSSELLQEELL